MSNRCEDYPCCGHTDGLGCNYTPDYSNPHFLCDHENGECAVQDALDDIFENDEDCCETGDANFSSARQRWECAHCGEPVDGPDAHPMEDQWLDGSYEE